MARTRDVLDDLAEWYGTPGNAAAAGGGGAGARTSMAQPEVALRPGVRRGAIRVVEAFLAWHDRARERRALMQLSDHILRDIGLSRVEAHREAAKPFWRL